MPLDFSPIQNAFQSIGSNMQSLAKEARETRHQGLQDQALIQGMQIRGQEAAYSEYEHKQKMKQAEADQKPLYLKEFKDLFEKHPATSKMMLELGAMHIKKDAVGEPYIETKAAKDTMALLYTNKDLQNNYNKLALADTHGNLDKVNAQIKELSSKGELNDKDQKELGSLNKEKQQFEGELQHLVKATSMEEHPIGKPNPKDFTPQSLGKYAQTGNLGDLEKDPKGGLEKDPKGDFETFKAGMPIKEGESKADWNKRVSDSWETKQDQRAKNKVEFGVTVRGAEKAKEEKAPFSDQESHQIDVMTTAIKDGRMAPSQLNTAIQRMGGGKSSAKLRTAIVSKVLESGMDLEAAENNYKAKGSSTAIQRVQLAKTVIPIANEVKALVDRIPDGMGFVPADEVARKLGRLFNNDELVKLEFNKNKMVEEFERMLTGSQMADSRVQRNLELVRTGYSKKALKELADEVIKISKTSVSAVSSPMYDINPKNDWMAKAKKLNPNMSNTDIEKEWNKKQGAK
jgi:hypothetical protein